MADAFASFTRFAKKFQRGSVIFAEFDVGESFYLVQSGRVRLIKIINGKERYLDVLQPGEIFGEMSILDNSPRSASCGCVRRCCGAGVQSGEFRSAHDG